MIPTSRNVVKVNFTEGGSNGPMKAPSSVSSAISEGTIPNHPTLQYKVDKTVDPCVDDIGTSTSSDPTANDTACINAASGFDLDKRIDGTLLRAPSKVAAPMGGSAQGSEACLVCRNGNKKTFRCTRCRSVLYCSAACQKLHWGFHKKICVKLKDCREKYAERYAGSTISSANEGSESVATSSTAPAARVFNPYDDAVSIPWLNLSGKVGLNNLGNSCYLNSGLQCLSHIVPLSTYFMSDQFVPHVNAANRDGTGGSLARVYSTLLRELWFGGNTAVEKLASLRDKEGATADGAYSLNGMFNSMAAITAGNGGEKAEGGAGKRGPSMANMAPSASSISPNQLKKVLGGINEDYRGFVQQDAHDVLETVLDRLHEDVNRVDIPKPYVPNCDDGNGSNDHTVANKSYENHLKRNNSIVDDIMGGQLRSQLTCNVCRHVSVSFEFTRCLSLAIPRSTTRLIRVVAVPNVCVYDGPSDHAHIMPRPRMYAMRVNRTNTTMFNIKQILSNTVMATSRIATGDHETGSRSSRLLQRISETNWATSKAAAVTADDYVLMELHGNVTAPGSNNSDTVFEYCEGEDDAVDASTPKLSPKAAQAAAAVPPPSGASVRSRMHTISRIFHNDQLPISSQRAEDKEYVAFSPLGSSPVTMKGDYVFILQRTLITSSAFDPTHPLLHAHGGGGASDGKQVRFSEGGPAGSAGAGTSVGTDGSGDRTTAQLVGTPYAFYVDLSWSCAKARYLLWVHMVRRFFFDALVGASGADLQDIADAEASVDVRVRAMLKNVKVHAAIANQLPLRVVNQFGQGIQCAYKGRVEPTYAADCDGSDVIARAFGPGPAGAGAKPTKAMGQRVDYSDSKFGARVPINSDISLSEFLGDLTVSDSIAFLAVDYCDTGCPTLNARADVWSWFKSVNLREVEAVDVVISGTPDAPEQAGEEEADGESECASKASTDPIERFIATAANVHTDGSDDGCSITTHSVLLSSGAGGSGSGNPKSPPKRRYSSVVCAHNLSVLSLPALSPSATVSLEQCLHYYTQREKLEGDNAWYCGKCKKHQPAEKSVSLWKLPKVLMVTLKRFDFHNLQAPSRYGMGMGGNMTYNEKIDTFVDFPVHSLDVHPYMSNVRRSRSRTLSNMRVGEVIGRAHTSTGTSDTNSGVKSPVLSRTNTSTSSLSDTADLGGSSSDEIAAEMEEETLAAAALRARVSTKYDLFAVTNHYGRSGFGHYTAMAR